MAEKLAANAPINKVMNNHSAAYADPFAGLVSSIVIGGFSVMQLDLHRAVCIVNALFCTRLANSDKVGYQLTWAM